MMAEMRPICNLYPNQVLYVCNIILKLKNMQSKKNSGLNRALRIFLYFLLVTGVIHTLILYGIIPQTDSGLWGGLHMVSGLVFLILVGVHAGKYWKWYKLWFRGKLKCEKGRLVKFISVFFLLMLFSISSDGFLPRNIYILIHVLIGGVWIIGIIRHFKSKKQFNPDSRITQ